MTAKPQALSRDLVSTIDRFIVQLQAEDADDSAKKIAALEDLRMELHTRGTIPFEFGDPGATVLWDLIERSDPGSGE